MTKSVAPMAVAAPVWMQFVFPTIMSQLNSVLIPVDSLESVLLVAVVTMTVKTAKCAAPMDVVKLVLPALPSPSVAHTSDHSSMQLQWPLAFPGCPWVPTSHSVTLMGTTYLCSTMRGSPGVCTHRQGYLSLASTGGERWPGVETAQPVRVPTTQDRPLLPVMDATSVCAPRQAWQHAQRGRVWAHAPSPQ